MESDEGKKQDPLLKLIGETKGGSSTTVMSNALKGRAGQPAAGKPRIEYGINPYRDLMFALPPLLRNAHDMVYEAAQDNEARQKACDQIHQLVAVSLSRAQKKAGNGVALVSDLLQSMARSQDKDQQWAWQLYQICVFQGLLLYLFSSKAIAMDVEKFTLEDLMQVTNVMGALAMVPEKDRLNVLSTLHSLGELPVRLPASEITFTADQFRQEIQEAIETHGDYGVKRRPSDTE